MIEKKIALLLKKLSREVLTEKNAEGVYIPNPSTDGVKLVPSDLSEDGLLKKSKKRIIRGTNELEVKQKELLSVLMIDLAMDMAPDAALRWLFPLPFLRIVKLLKNEKPNIINKILNENAGVLVKEGLLEIAKALNQTAISTKKHSEADFEGYSELLRWFIENKKIRDAYLQKTSQVEIFDRIADYHYVPKYFGAAHKKLPKLPDMPVFGEVAYLAQKEAFCSLDYDRLYTIYNVLHAFLKSDNGKFGLVEIGAYRGGTSWFMSKIVNDLGLKNTTVHVCDTFSGFSQDDINVKIDRYEAGSFCETNVDRVRKLMSPFPDAKIHVGRIQDTYKQLPEKIGFIHLDVDLYKPTKFVLDNLYERLIPNGVIIVDDYNTKSCPGVLQAVLEFRKNNKMAFVLPLLTAQCVIKKQ